MFRYSFTITLTIFVIVFYVMSASEKTVKENILPLLFEFTFFGKNMMKGINEFLPYSFKRSFRNV